MSRTRFMLAVFAALVLFATPLFADGKIFSRSKPQVPMPDQQALIAFKDGVESLTIETRFNALGDKELAWIVPLPTKPEITPATSGIFPTLRNTFIPHLIDPDNPILYQVFCFLIIFLVVVCIVAIATKQRATFLKALFAFLLLTVVVAIFIPMHLENQKAMQPAPRAITILDSKKVGAYQTTTLEAKNSDALLKWLNENNFTTPDGIKEAAEYYISKHWIFVAVKIQQEADLKMLSATPSLTFTFKTDKAVYPARMTIVGGQNTKVDLYVFGKETANANNFINERCDHIKYKKYDSLYKALRDYRYDVKYGLPGIKVAHKGISECVMDLPVATKLTGELNAQNTPDDIEIGWQSFQHTQKDVYTRQGAINSLTGITIPAYLIILIIIAYSHVILKFGKTVKTKVIMVSISTIVLVSTLFILYSRMEIVNIPEQDESAGSFYSISSSLFDYSGDCSVESLRNQLAKYISENKIQAREEDSPNNYIFKEKDGGIQLVLFDEYGGEHIMPLTKKDQPETGKP